jgi:hypothetical protein
LDGDVARQEDFEPLYGQFLDPRDHSGQTYLGSPPRVNAELAAIYQAKLVTQPSAEGTLLATSLAPMAALGLSHEYKGWLAVSSQGFTSVMLTTASRASTSALRR